MGFYIKCCEQRGTHQRSTFAFQMKSSLNQDIRNVPKMDLFSACSSFPPPNFFKFHVHFWRQFIIWSYLPRTGNFFVKSSWNKLHLQNKTYHRPVETVPEQTVFWVCLKECYLEPRKYFLWKHSEWSLSSKVNAWRPCDLWSSQAAVFYNLSCLVIIQDINMVVSYIKTKYMDL